MSKLQSNMSPNMTMDNQFNLFSLEDGSGEAGFENKIIETIVKDAETDHILDNERPKDRKLVVEDLIEQKKVCFCQKGCWRRMLETKCVDDKMLVTDFRCL